MESLGRIQTQHQSPLHFSLPRLSFSKPFLPSLLPKTPLSKTTTSSSIPKTFLRASFHHNHHHLPPKHLLPSLPKNPTNPFHFLNPQNPSLQNPSLPPKPLSSLIKSISISIATLALLLARFPTKPAFAAAPAAPPSTMESILSDSDSVSEADKETTLEEHLNSHPDDVKALKSLMECRIKLQKVPQAIETIERLIQLEPTEKEWPLLRAHLHLHGGDVDVAKSVFEDIIAADPFRVEAYHGLIMAVAQSEPGDMDALMKRIGDVMELCKKERRKEDLRDFKLLVAQLRVIEGKYEEALKLYGELVKEEPGDFRPYLCQGIIYTLIGKKDKAEKQFEKYQSLVPKGHPYAQYFNDNVLATKIFSQMAEEEKVGSKR
ncbi:protein SLOW GREEN 1, chloroplastic [Cinnamomum micranthum f. kanehirae]|uniref:Protein SLOW GREEN 1, chloroplastic n=1 Tax=Cinnamomum micranthum f. kanehirae TaxID=337451 RepID=A0A443PXK1_9MAGN|nr:protein SLOW GREEN 1, chloroplastic [Cinnamomum micranthum f. kanehirae]